MEIVLSQESDGGDVRTVWARTASDGSLAIGGQDIGSGVENIFRCREYEWAITIAADDVPAAAYALETRPGEDVLDALQRRWGGNQVRRMHARLKDRGVSFGFWSRIGD